MTLKTTAFLCITLCASGALNGTSAQDSDPISANLTYKGEVWNVASGGLQSGTRYLQNIDLSLDIDLSTFGVNNSSIYFQGLINNRAELSGDLVGDAQVISNIDNGEVYRLYEAWYQYDGAKARIKTGLIDLNSEFDVIDPAGLFINSSHGIGPDFSQTGENGPSIFPSTSLAALIEWKLSEKLTFSTGIFDAVPNDPNNPKKHKISLNDGALFVGEINYRSENGFRLALGSYGYTAKFDPLIAGTPKHLRAGLYGIIEGPLSENTSAWLRVGSSDNSVNQFSHYIGGGVVMTDPFGTTGGDQLGFAVGNAINGPHFKAQERIAGNTPAAAETTFELTYRRALSKIFTIQPDIQYVVNPSGLKNTKNALVLGVRLESTFDF